MSEQETPKFFKMIKTVPGDVFMTICQASNPQLTKVIHLTSRNPFQMLPADWALGIFVNDGSYSLYKKGCITFENNEELVKLAYSSGIYFSEELDFTPVTDKVLDEIFNTLKTGNRAKIVSCIEKQGPEKVCGVARTHLNELTTNVVAMLENILKVQLIVDGGLDEEQN